MIHTLCRYEQPALSLLYAIKFIRTIFLFSSSNFNNFNLVEYVEPSYLNEILEVYLNVHAFLLIRQYLTIEYSSFLLCSTHAYTNQSVAKVQLTTKRKKLFAKNYTNQLSWLTKLDDSFL